MDEELKYVFDRLEEEEKIITFYKSKKGKENKSETEKDFFGMSPTVKLKGIFETSIQVLFRKKTKESFDPEDFLNLLASQLSIKDEDIQFDQLLNDDIIQFTIKNKDIIEVLRNSDFKLKNYEDIEIQIGDDSISNFSNPLLFPKGNAEFSLGKTFWNEPKTRGGFPYFCPVGWKRFSLNITQSKKEFDKKFKDWRVVYHGTSHDVANLILNTGFKSNKWQDVYFSPSIEYCSIPRYSKIWKRKSDGKFIQLVLQCRLNPKSISKIQSETMLKENERKTQIDPNFDNGELELVIRPNEGESVVHFEDYKVICTGIMLRVSDNDPIEM